MAEYFTLMVKVVLNRDMSSRQHVDPEISITAKVQQINIVILYQFIMTVRVCITTMPSLLSMLDIFIGFSGSTADQ